MALTSKDIQIGSGHLYVTTWDPDTGVPDDTTSLEIETNRAGHVSGGAKLTWTPTFYEAKDDLEMVKVVVLQTEDIKLNTGVCTWNNTTIQKLISTSTNTIDPTTHIEDLKGGGIANWNKTDYMWIFVSQDKTKRIIVVGSNQSAAEIAFQQDKETVVGIEISAKPLDSAGHKFIFRDSTNEVPPSP